MKINLFAISLVAFLSMFWQSNAQTTKNAVNYLGVQGPITLNKNVFGLVWSSHPDPSFYKHEYLTTGDAFPNYKSMVTIDFVVTGLSVDQAVAAKVRELDQLKKGNNDVNFQVINNPATGEKIIDCLIVQTAADEKKSIAEHDVYRFKSVKAKSGQHGILLLALSTRKYGKDIKAFLINLKTDKPVMLSEVARFPVPELNLLEL